MGVGLRTVNKFINKGMDQVGTFGIISMEQVRLKAIKEAKIPAFSDGSAKFKRRAQTKNCCIYLR